MKFEARYYTIKCVCELYKYVKAEYEESYMSIDTDYTIGEIKYQLAIFDLLDAIILKLDIKLLKKKENDIVSIDLTEYQRYFFSKFLFENRKKHLGIAEQTSLNTLAINIDQGV